jgi:uncharacterized protein YlzI (FlbEa/FlbD family)
MILAIIVASCLCEFARAQSESVNLLVAKIDGDSLVHEVTIIMQVTETIDKEIEVNGKKVVVKEAVVKNVPSVVAVKVALKGLVFVNNDGKEIDVAEVTKLLKEPQPVVMSILPMSEEWRKRFRSGTIFIHNKK